MKQSKGWACTSIIFAKILFWNQLLFEIKLTCNKIILDKKKKNWACGAMSKMKS